MKPRPRHELVMRAFHPLVGPGVRLLERAEATPEQVVVLHALIGVLAAALIATPEHGAWVVAAVLLQFRTVLDNLDGALARATGRVTELGRYLDTGADFIVNACVFVALAFRGPPLSALLAFVVLTVLLSYDFNAERLYKETHGGRSPQGQPLATSGPHRAAAVAGANGGGLALTFFKGLYTALLAPQDRAIRRLEERLLERASGRQLASLATEERAAWWGIGSTGALVNLGLSTQYVVLGICLVVGSPFTYVWLVLAQGVYLVGVIAVRFFVHRRRYGHRP